MGTHNKTRDFTAGTIEEFEKYIDKYFHDGRNAFERLIDNAIKDVTFSFKNIIRLNDQDDISENFIRTLENDRSSVEREIISIWKEIAGIEQSYCHAFEHNCVRCESLTNIFRKIESSIQLDNLDNFANCNLMLRECGNDYLNMLEGRAVEITKKTPDELTDEDIEILAYVALNTTDNDLKERIYKTFYTETTSQRINYVIDKPDKPYYRFYDRNEEKWDKFVKDSELYYQQTLDKYYNGELTDEQEFNKIIRNKLLIEYMDEEGKLIFSSGSNDFLSISDKGEVTFVVPGYDHAVVWYKKQENPNGKLVEKEDISLSRITKEYDCEPNVYEGEDASYAIDKEISDEIRIQRRSNPLKEAYDGIKGKLVGLINEAFPGFKVVTKVSEKMYKKGVEEGIITTGEEVISADEKPDYSWFAKEFDLKCVMNNGDYVLIPTNKSCEIISELDHWIREHKDQYTNTYESYLNLIGTDGEKDAYSFITSVDVAQFRNMLSEVLEPMRVDGVFS